MSLQRLTPTKGFLVLFRLMPLIFVPLALIRLVPDLLSKDGLTSKTLVGLFFLLMSGQALALGRVGIYIRGSGLEVRTGMSVKRIRFPLVKSFEWLNNLEVGGEAGKRLWVVLTDGQKVATAVVTGPTWKIRAEVHLSRAEGEALVETLTNRCRVLVLPG